MSALDRKVSGISPAVQTCLFPAICDTLQAKEKGNIEKRQGRDIEDPETSGKKNRQA